jgi:hypothetical protein
MTGYVVDEIDGRYFVVQSDDPDDIENGVKWTVNNTYVTTVAEFMADQQQQGQKMQLPTPTLLQTFPSEKVKSPAKPSKDVELFLSCLETELAINESSGNRTPV